MFVRVSPTFHCSFFVAILFTIRDHLLVNESALLYPLSDSECPIHFVRPDNQQFNRIDQLNKPSKHYFSYFLMTYVRVKEIVFKNIVEVCILLLGNIRFIMLTVSQPSPSCQESNNILFVVVVVVFVHIPYLFVLFESTLCCHTFPVKLHQYYEMMV